MSYYPMDYSMTNPGTPFWWNAPMPTWGTNPMTAGPQRVGVGGCGCGSPVGQEPRVAEDVEAKYQQATWGHVTLGVAGGLIMGLVIGHVAGRRAEKRREDRAHERFWRARSRAA